jgi:hypothetical protein
MAKQSQPTNSYSKAWEAVRPLYQSLAALMQTLDAHEKRIRELEARCRDAAAESPRPARRRSMPLTAAAGGDGLKVTSLRESPSTASER